VTRFVGDPEPRCAECGNRVEVFTRWVASFNEFPMQMVRDTFCPCCADTASRRAKTVEGLADWVKGL
jgi:hypothetical protein